jgi:hypothetical protein
VSRWRASPRFRRRVTWTACLLAALGGVVAVAFATTNRSDRIVPPTRAGAPQVETVPASAVLSKADALKLVRATRTFVTSAVAGRRLDVAYDMVGPELRGGLSRDEWTHGGNPVVPFPAAGIANVGVAYSYRNDVALDLSLLAKPGSDTVGKTFRIEFRRPRAKAPWRVVAWLPQGISTSSNVRSLAQQEAAAATVVKDDGPRLAAWWLAFPAVLLSGVLLLPVTLGVRSWRASRRAERAYRESISSSSPS